MFSAELLLYTYSTLLKMYRNGIPLLQAEDRRCLFGVPCISFGDMHSRNLQPRCPHGLALRPMHRLTSTPSSFRPRQLSAWDTSHVRCGHRPTRADCSKPCKTKLLPLKTPGSSIQLITISGALYGKISSASVFQFKMLTASQSTERQFLTAGWRRTSRFVQDMQQFYCIPHIPHIPDPPISRHFLPKTAPATSEVAAWLRHSKIS